jgi:cytochrome bd-type quinol oxidase subunit 2
MTRTVNPLSRGGVLGDQGNGNQAQGNHGSAFLKFFFQKYRTDEVKRSVDHKSNTYKLVTDFFIFRSNIFRVFSLVTGIISMFLLVLSIIFLAIYKFNHDIDKLNQARKMYIFSIPIIIPFIFNSAIAMLSYMKYNNDNNDNNDNKGSSILGAYVFIFILYVSMGISLHETKPEQDEKLAKES